MSSYITRPLGSREIILAGDETVAHGGGKPHLSTGTVIECDGQIAAVLRGHTLTFHHEDEGVVSEIVGSVEDAVARMRELIDGEQEPFNA